MSPSKNKLQVSKLVKSYRGRRVVDGISFEINSGEVLGMLGPNGAGKTTTFYILVGLVSPEQGEIFVNGERIDHMPMWERARKGITYLPQEPSIFRGMTVEENLSAIAEISNINKDEQTKLVEQLLDDFGIKRLRRQMANTLSGGERRRTEIARSLVINPCFILLDEPFTGIDPIAIQELQRIIRSLQEKGLGVLMTDHSVRETLKIVDRAYIIDKGRILKEGTPGEIVGSQDVRRNYLGEDFRL